MNVERDYLVKDTFYKIRELCNERNVEFVPIELRWGLSAAKGKAHIISACLNEIKESQPYFIGIVGDRYGWIPTMRELYESNTQDVGSASEERRYIRPKIFDHYPWLESDIQAGLSITEIEMQFAALRNGNDKALFYIKTVPTAHSSDDKQSGKNICTLSEVIEGLFLNKKLSALKEKIYNAQNVRVAEYSSIHELGDSVYRDVKSIIDKEFPIDNTYKTEEFWHQKSFRQKANASLYDLSQYYSVIDARFQDKNTRLIRLEGVKGCGKSFLLVNYLLHLQESGKRVYYYDVKEVDSAKQNINFIIDFENYITYIIARDLGLTIKESKTGWLKRAFRAAFQINRIAISSLFRKHQTDNIQHGVQSVLTQYYADVLINPIIQDIRKRLEIISTIKEEIVIGIDNIDHLSLTELVLTDDLDFFPSNIKFVYSARPETKLWNNSYTYSFQCDNLYRKDIESYIRAYFKKYGKEDIGQEAIDKMRYSALSDTPLNLNRILDLLVSFGSFEYLDSEIERLTSIKNKKPLYKELVITLMSAFDSDEHHPVSDILASIALSNRGLTEEEIRDITHVEFNDWISIRPHIKELIDTENNYFIPEADLKDTILETLPHALLVEKCKEMVRFFSALFSFRTNGFGLQGVVEDELNNLKRQASELPRLYEYQKDYASLGHYISFPFHDEYLLDNERIHYWKVLYSNNHCMSEYVDIDCCYSSSKYSLKYRNISNSRISGHKDVILDPSEEDVQDFLSRLILIASLLLKGKDYAWLVKHKTNISSSEGKLLSKIQSQLSERDFDSFLSDYESGTYTYFDNPVMVETLVSIALFHQKNIEKMKAHLGLALAVLDGHQTTDFSTFSTFLMACSYYLLVSKDLNVAETLDSLIESHNFTISNQVTQDNFFYFFGNSIVQLLLGRDCTSSLSKAIALSKALFGEDSEFYQISTRLPSVL